MKKLFLLFVLTSTIAARQATPQSVVDELLAADRAFSVASAKSDVVSGLSAMFADEVMLTHAGGIAAGKAAAIDARQATTRPAVLHDLAPRPRHRSLALHC